MIKQTAILTGLILAACVHQPPPAKSERLLDDAELEKYREQKSVRGATGVRDVVTLGRGEVDLSNWKSSAERSVADGDAAAGGPVEGFAAGCNSADGCPPGSSDYGAMPAAMDAGSGDASMGGEPEPTDAASADVNDVDDVDFDAGRTVEADDVTLVPADDE